MGLFDDLSKAASDAAKNVQGSIAESQRKSEEARAAHSAQEAEIAEKGKGIVVTTGDLHQDYEIIRPVFFQVSIRNLTFPPGTQTISAHSIFSLAGSWAR